MSAHTPGPWVVSKRFRTPVVGYDVGDGGEHLPIVDVVHGYDMKQARANARLIAAAPDLLFQLLAASNYIDALGGDSRSYRAAIAAARGQA